MYMHNIDSTMNSIIEDYVKDTDYIYNTNSTIGNANGYVTNEELQDRSFTRSVFINTVIQEGVMCLDRSGMITTAKYKANIKSRDVANRIANVDRTNKLQMTEGVYVVREWTIRTFRGRMGYSNASLIDYYNNIESYIRLPDSELAVLKEKLADMVRVVGSYDKTNDIKIRSISFIPLDMLLEYKTVYDIHSDLVFSVGALDTGIMHPSSEVYTKIHSTEGMIATPDTNTIEVELIDNYTPGKKYYTMVGNQCATLRSRGDNYKTDGATVHITRGGIRSHAYDVNKDELESVGIYTNEEEARYAGDIKNGLELSKVQLEYDKIEQQLKSLEYDKTKLEHDKFKMEKEKEQLLAKHARELELADLKVKATLIDYHKLTNTAIIDIKTKLLDLKLKQVNHLTSNIEAMEKHQRDMAMLDYKISGEIAKNKTKNTGTIIDAVVKYGSMLLK